MLALLLLLVAALLTASAALYFMLRQVQSRSAARESIAADELHEAQEALQAAMDRLERLEQRLDQKERPAQAPISGSPTPAAPISSAEPPAAPATSTRDQVRHLARLGLTPAAIARELELPVGEVELLLRLRE